MSLRELMHAVAREFNEYVERPAWEPDITVSTATAEGRPGDDYNQRATWSDLLRSAGWEPLRETSGLTYWRRPGKDDGACSATTGLRSDCGKDLLYVFSTNAQPFENETSYTKFSAFALLRHRGDYGAAAKDLASQGYGEPERPAGKIILEKPRPNADTSSDPLDQDATAFDLIEAHTTICWAWEGWLPVGVLTIIASEPGVGKTRFCADLARRVANGLPWPDGTAQTFPAGSRTLWVPADNQHPELGSLPIQFGFLPSLLYLNATKRNLFAGTMLDSPEDLKDFEARIGRVRPAIVFVDTCLNATDRTSHKPEDAKAFFKPLQEIAARTQTVLVCVTHLNAAGKPLGRRIEGQGRVVIMLEKPGEEETPRRKLWVKKTNSLTPKPLGITMGDRGNEYDLNPPEIVRQPAGVNVAAKESRIKAAAEWLTGLLKNGSMKVSVVRDAAETKGFSTKTLYAAVEMLSLHQFEMQGRKWWQLTSEDEQPLG